MDGLPQPAPIGHLSTAPVIASARRPRAFRWVVPLVGLLAVATTHAEPGDTIIARQGGWYPQVSTDGRFVLYWGSDDSGTRGPNLFVLDRTTGHHEAVNDADTNHSLMGWNWPMQAAMSGDGRYVVWCHLFKALIRDRVAGTIEPIIVKGRPYRTRSCDFALNEDGRYLVFDSDRADLVTNDTNGVDDVFVLDRTTGGITRASESTTGTQADRDAFDPAISGDGRIVKFLSRASTLVAGDTNDADDVFVRDLATGITTRVNLDASGGQTTGASSRFTALPKGQTLSFDGRFVVFVSGASTLVPDDTNDREDVFVVDRSTGAVEMVSVNDAGKPGDWGSDEPSISHDGRYVSFESISTNLVPGDYGLDNDVYVRDRALSHTERASVWSSGAESTNLAWGQSFSGAGRLSGDGRYIVFHSTADLAPRVPTYEGGTYLHEVGGRDFWVFSVKPHSAEFPDQPVGGQSAPQVFTVRNDGTQPLTIRELELRGAEKAHFRLSSDCAAAVPVGSQCTASVSFAPSSVGRKDAVLKVVFDTGGPRPVRTGYVSGTGVP